MAKKYEILEEQSSIVSEPPTAYAYNEGSAIRSMAFHNDRSCLDMAISGEELKARLIERLKSRFL